MTQHDKDHDLSANVFLISCMDDNDMVLENNSLFLDLDQAVLQFAEVISHYNRNDLLMVVLCDDVMPVGNQIARRLGLTLTFSPVGTNTTAPEFFDKGIPVDFDYGMVKESGRDIPQNYITHQEQNLRSSLMARYTATYETVANTYPDKLIILVDQLTSINAAFFPCVTRGYESRSGGNSFSNTTTRQFVFIHARIAELDKRSTHGLDMIIGHR